MRSELGTLFHTLADSFNRLNHTGRNSVLAEFLMSLYPELV
jgi:hypothetical protein